MKLPFGGPLLALAIITKTAGSAAAQNLVVNGGFEEPKAPIDWFSSYHFPSRFSGWIVESGAVDIVGTNFYASASGVQSLDLNELLPGAVYQEMATMQGRAYTLRFAFAPNPVTEGPSPSPPVKRMEVLWSGKPLAVLTADSTARTRADIGWKSFSYQVVAIGKDRLTFRSLSGGGSGPVIDDVALFPADQNFGVIQNTVVTRAVPAAAKADRTVTVHAANRVLASAVAAPAGQEAGLTTNLTIRLAAQICWPTRPGVFYQVQWASQVEATVWNYLSTPILGDGTTNCFVDPVVDDKRFYRVLESE